MLIRFLVLWIFVKSQQKFQFWKNLKKSWKKLAYATRNLGYVKLIMWTDHIMRLSWLVSWSLTSLFITNMAISETNAVVLSLWATHPKLRATCPQGHKKGVLLRPGWYWRQIAGVNKQRLIPQESGDGWRTDEAGGGLSSVLVVGASRFLQCFDTVGWLTGRASGLWKTCGWEASN